MNIDYTISNELHTIRTKIDLIIVKNNSILLNKELSDLIEKRDKLLSIQNGK